jgi:hypothetical protein
MWFQPVAPGPWTPDGHEPGENWRDRWQRDKALTEADQELARMQAEGVPGDDPHFMETLEEYQRLGAEIVLGPDSPAFLAVKEPEAE